ncbi:MAG: glycosyltransferase family 87 protein [Gemmataceae bacterium]
MSKLRETGYTSALMRAAIQPLLNPQRCFVACLLLFFAAVSGMYAAKVLTPRNGETTRSAIVRWREQLQGLDSGENIYARYTYPNPPIMAIMLRPLAELPPLTGALLWFALKVGFTLAAFAFVFRLAEDDGVPFPPWAKAVTVLLSLRPVLGDLMHGNVNLFILFLVAGGLMLYRRRWDFTAGLLIALAIACKVTPALFLPYFVWKGAWRTVAGIFAGLGLFLFVVPGIVLGWSENWELLNSWVNQMVTPYLMGVVTSEHPNQSLPGLIARLFTHSPSFIEFQNDQPVPSAYHTIVDLGPAAKWIGKGAMGLFVLAVVTKCRTRTEPRTRSGLGAEFALITLGMLLFSERTWKHHAVTLMLPFAVLCYQMAVTESPRWRARLITTLSAAALLMATTSTGLLPDDWAKLAQVYGAYTFTFLLLAVACVWILSLSPNAPARAC